MDESPEEFWARAYQNARPIAFGCATVLVLFSIAVAAIVAMLLKKG